MRITGGRAAGIQLSVPAKGVAIRPATDRMREAVFSSLGHLVTNASVLDLFAGSGSYGLEALSRGASSARFVENNSRAVSALERNRDAVLRALGEPLPRSSATISLQDFRKAAFGSRDQFDLVFADPPYARANEWLADILAVASRALTENKHGCLVIELPGEMQIDSPGWNEARRFGKDRSGPSARFLKRV